jgi:hypothetical protein
MDPGLRRDDGRGRGARAVNCQMPGPHHINLFASLHMFYIQNQNQAVTLEEAINLYTQAA